MQSIDSFNKYKEEKKLLKSKVSSSNKMAKLQEKKQQGEKVPKAKIYKPTGEAKMFEDIRNERPHICKVCTRHIKEARTRCFAHIFSKKMFPKYRLIKANIALVCSPECHNKLDSMMMSFKKDRNNMLYFDKILWCLK